jgi:DNA protecting protein DprA
MEILRFAHRFFHFESAAWRKACERSNSFEKKGPDWHFARRLFRENLLPRRQLRRGVAQSFEEAVSLHERYCAQESSFGIRVLSESCPSYPEAIRQYVPPERRPPLLYVRGPDLPAEPELVGIVGTRSPSHAGMEAAACFSAYLSALGIRVVSGLARGIDTLAHQQSLETRAVAVLGSEVGNVYPEQNQELAESILAKGGTLLSPFPLDQVPLPQNFPDRNELIAALASGIIVVEGAEKSGAAITGRQALAMGKTVVVLTQDFRTSFGRGAIRLQQDGAVLAAREEEAVEAIFRRFGGFVGKLPPKWKVPKKRSFTFQEFQKAVKLNVPEAVTMLEEGILQGRIEKWGEKYRLT